MDYPTKDCSCLDIIEADVCDYLDNKPKIKKILEKQEPTSDDVFKFINLIQKEIADFNNYIHYKNMRRYNSPLISEEEHLSKAKFLYPAHLRKWYNMDCPSYTEEEYMEEELIRDGIDNYWIDTTYHTIRTSCFVNPGTYPMVKGAFRSYLFNKLCEGGMIVALHNFSVDNQKHQDQLHYLENLLIEISERSIYSRQWKGSNYYFYRIFGYPKYFCKKYFIYDVFVTDVEQKIYDELNKTKHKVDISKCKKEYAYNFKAMIEGHPLASNGIFQEGLRELEELGCF